MRRVNLATLGFKYKKVLDSTCPRIAFSRIQQEVVNIFSEEESDIHEAFLTYLENVKPNDVNIQCETNPPNPKQVARYIIEAFFAHNQSAKAARKREEERKRERQVAQKRKAAREREAAAEAADKEKEPHYLEQDRRKQLKWVAEHKQNGVAPFIVSSLHQWMDMGYVLGLSYPRRFKAWYAGTADSKAAQAAQAAQAAYRFMQEGVYDMMDVVVHTIELLHDVAKSRQVKVSDEYDGTAPWIHPQHLPSGSITPLLGFMRRVRDVFGDTQHKYTQGNIAPLLLDKMPAILEPNVTDDAAVRDTQNRLNKQMPGTSPMQMFDIVWNQLGKTEMPDLWTQALEKMKLYAQTTYLMCAYVTSRARIDKGTVIIEYPPPQGKLPQLTGESKVTGEQLLWLSSALWNTEGGFEGADDGLSARETAYQEWAKNPGQGMRRTLGVLYYATLTTLARITSSGEHVPATIANWVNVESG